ncbi:hypothetical protein F4V43_12480 [Paenibacillus spiritus]|uniref:Uncharacterized protein n=1 Tax=Paenibacillus spiritus TaxID=2496557 RepID=A0A5J5GAQ8_9BACL|nr:MULTISPECIES: hypothetical protein [Paenibacillus]KAA9004205.1 hypothetical protein F4V43_12480 [Paenibacillus spiritus]
MPLTKTYYFGTLPRMLDPVSLEESSFAALWFEEEEQRFIVGYGFGSRQIDKLKQFMAFTAHFTCCDERITTDIYREIRQIQQEHDWTAHRRLPFLSVFRAPWNRMEPGWYILKSRSVYPLHLSVVRRTPYSIWLEHVSVCESEAELRACIEKAGQAHKLDPLRMRIATQQMKGMLPL